MKKFVLSPTALIYSMVVAIILRIALLCLKDPAVIMEIVVWAILGLGLGFVIQIIYNLFKPGAMKSEIYEYLLTFMIVFVITAFLKLMHISYNRTNWLIGLVINEVVIISALAIRSLYYKRLNKKLNDLKGNYIKKQTT
jgi:hypothetical protein